MPGGTGQSSFGTPLYATTGTTGGIGTGGTLGGGRLGGRTTSARTTGGGLGGLGGRTLGTTGGGLGGFGGRTLGTTGGGLGGFGGRTFGTTGGGLGGFGGRTFGTTGGGLGGFGGRTFGTAGGGFGTMTGRGMGSGFGGSLNSGLASSTPVIRPTPYLATPAFIARPVAPPRVRTDLQQVLARSTALPSGRGMQVVMDGSVVVLQGRVADDHERRLAEAMLRLSPGVREIRNELGVQGGTPVSTDVP
jgi:hypothetical protein